MTTLNGKRGLIIGIANEHSLAYGVNEARSLPLLCGGGIDSMQGDPHFIVRNEAGKPLAAHEWGKGHAIDHKTALHFVITWMEANLADMKVVAAGHRVVLGGTRFEAPTCIEGDVLDYLESLSVMEPSHQPFNVRGARALADAFPGLPVIPTNEEPMIAQHTLAVVRA